MANPVVFDLDGTLVDSRRDLAAAVDALRGELGLAPLGLAAVTAMVGEGARVLVARALADWSGAGGARGTTTATAATASLDGPLARFLALYDERCLDTTTVYPGMGELVVRLAGERSLAVLTNKPARMTHRLLSHLGLASSFSLVVAGDTLPVRKPDPAGLHAVAAHFGCAPAVLTLVGDSLIDVETARAGGCACVSVGWGFLTVDRLLAGGSGPVVQDAVELARRLGGS